MKIIIIGSGVGGLGAACLLAQAGHDVTVLEKNADFGGRAGQFKEKGFTFPYGPTWFLMPEVFERFYDSLGEKITDHLRLKKLDPLFKAHFEGTLIQPIEITGNRQKDAAALDNLEPNAHQKLARYLADCQQKYELAMENFVYRNFSSPLELLKPENLRATLASGLGRNLYDHAGQYFLNEQIRQIFSYPAVFVGASPFKAPSVYSMINHSLLGGSVFWPKGGMYAAVESLLKIAKSRGAKLEKSAEVSRIICSGGVAKKVRLKTGEELPADIVISNAGLPHTELSLLRDHERSHSPKYWHRKNYSPSAMVLFLGLKGNLKGLPTHNLILAPHWHEQFKKLESSRSYPDQPSIYLCNLSSMEPQATPKNHSAWLAIVPLPTGLRGVQKELDAFADKVMNSLAKNMGVTDLGERIVYKKFFAERDFAERYNAWRGSMLGLSHTTTQTGPFRPQNKSKKLDNLYYVGADTMPGIGVPLTLISAELTTERIKQDLKR